MKNEEESYRLFVNKDISREWLIENSEIEFEINIRENDSGIRIKMFLKGNGEVLLTDVLFDDWIGRVVDVDAAKEMIFRFWNEKKEKWSSYASYYVESILQINQKANEKLISKEKLKERLCRLSHNLMKEEYDIGFLAGFEKGAIWASDYIEKIKQENRSLSQVGENKKNN